MTMRREWNALTGAVIGPKTLKGFRTGHLVPADRGNQRRQGRDDRTRSTRPLSISSIAPDEIVAIDPMRSTVKPATAVSRQDRSET